MNMNEPATQRLLRLWPGVAAAVLLVLIGYVVPIFAPRFAGLGMIGAVVCALIVLLWWLFFSRARWYERLGGIALMIAAAFAEKYVVHPSIAGGAMGNLAYVLAIPTLSVALVAWAGASRRLAPGARAAAVVVAVVFGCLPWILLRTGGINADGKSDFHWRWTKTPEDQLLAQGAGEPTVAAPAPVAAEIPKEPLPATPDAPARTETPAPAAPVRRAEWPGFRGPERDGVIRGVQIATDWSQSPPVQLWRRAIGPGWSSFAVSGNLLYTQEQRGGDEVVSCYRMTTGEPVWRHRDATRFWESNAGAGPRGTPTLSNGRVYTFGGTGILNVLDAISGAVVWSRNAASDVNAKTPMWGFSSSPAGRRRRRHRRGGRQARRLRRRDGRAALDRRRRGLELQLAASRHDRRSRAGGVHERAGHDQRRAGHRQGALAVRVGGRRDRPAGGDGRWRHSGQHHLA